MQNFKKLYLDSVNQLKVTRNLAICAMLAAIAVVLNFTTSIQLGPYIRIGFSDIPNRIVDFLFGPVVGGIFGGMLDILKFFTKPTGPFFFGFTFNAIISGIIYGSFLYNKPVKASRIILCQIVIKLVVNCGLTTLWLSMMYDKGFMILLPARFIKEMIMIPIDSVILYFSLTIIQKLRKRMNI